MIRRFNPDTLYQPETYPNAVEVSGDARWVVSSGIIGMHADGTLPSDPAAQVQLAWHNVAAFLSGCGLTADNLVKLTTHFAHADIIDLSREARIQTFGPVFPCAVTGTIVQLMDPSYLIEIDVWAAD